MFFEWLTHPMVLPVSISLLAGVVCLLIPAFAARLRAWFTVLVTAWVLYLAWQVFGMSGESYDPGLLSGSWLEFRVDALSGFTLLAMAFFAFLIAVFSLGYMKGRERQREYYTYYLWTLGAACAVALSNDLLFLLVCWGVLGLLLYLMIGIAGPGAAQAARKSLVIIGASDAVLLFGVVLYWQLTGSTQLSGAGMSGVGLEMAGAATYVAFLAFICAAFAKAGVVPFHSWVPDFGEQADAPVSAYLPASLDKLLGIYLLARCVMDLFEPTPGMYLMLMALGAITIISAVLMALVQHDLKRLLSYHAVSQVGYMVLGIGTGTAIGLAGGLFHMLNNTLYKTALFLCAGVIEKETGTTDLDRLGGLAKLLPFTFIAATIAALAISGIPPLNGFASKWMIYQGVISTSEAGGMSWIVWLAVAMLGSALTLASFVKVLHATFLCKPSPQVRDRQVQESSLAMLLPLGVLATLCVVFGVFAFQVPLAGLVLPIVPAAESGVWWAGMATVLILASIVIGLLVYWLSMRAGKLRRVSTYIGGERMQDVFISGNEAGAARHVEMTGVDFYQTIEQLPALQRYYALTRARAFDLYDLFRKGGGYGTIGLRTMHTGVLPVYLRWFVAGLVVVVWVVTQAGS